MAEEEKVKKVGLLTATAIVVASMVGTGIFGSLGYQVVGIPSGFPILLLWLFGGIISICGALCYAELAAMFPRSGGEYQLLNCCWPKLVGFLSGCVSITAGFTAPVALNSALFGKYLSAVTGYHANWFAVPVILLVCLIHLGSLRRIVRFQSGFTLAKILLILVLGVLGFTLGTSQNLTFRPQAGDREMIMSTDFGISLVYVLYAYAGWNAATYMIDEIRDPRRIVPLAILMGTGLVTLLYLFVNAAFLYSTPIESLAGQAEAGLISAKAILGEKSGTVMGLIIAFGLISTISSMTWAGPRVTAEIGKDYRFFRWFSRLNHNGVPARSIVLQSAVAIVMVLSATFEELIHYIQALLTLSSLAVVAGMMWLRIRKPELERPFRAWGYPVTPLVFMISTGAILYVQVSEKPAQCLWGMVTLVIGLVVYWLSVRSKEME